MAGWIPALFGYAQTDTAAGGVELIVMSRVAGRPVRHLTMPTGARGRLIGEVARLLRTVHAVDVAAPPVGGLVPVDDGWAALHRRLEWGFADLIEALAEPPAGARLPVPAERVAAAALAALPTGTPWRPVVLHSNPGPTPVFADPAGAFTGVIDFGDAYVSHPALDLRSWPDPADRVSLRAAYLDGEPAGSDFDAVWTVAMVYTDLKVLAGRPALAVAAGDDLAPPDWASCEPPAASGRRRAVRAAAAPPLPTPPTPPTAPTAVAAGGRVQTGSVGRCGRIFARSPGCSRSGRSAGS